MSELKVIDLDDIREAIETEQSVYYEYYAKSKADKVIAELEENHKKEVGQLLASNREQAVYVNWLRESMNQVIRHQKFKRCLANAWWCLREEFSAEDCHCERWVDWAIKWHNRWLELAEQFKEAATATVRTARR